MTVVEAETVWEGADALRPFLILINDLEPHPGNPRRGDIASVVSSLRRFGQVRPLLANGPVMVAGHHVRQAALELGWTHVAVVPHNFDTDDEARAYLLADNRTHDLGPGYDERMLIEHLQHLDEFSTLRGTGYTNDDLDEMMANMIRMDAQIPEQPRRPAPALDVTEVVLMFSAEQHTQFEQWVSQASDRFGTEGVSETVYEALRAAH